MVLPRNRNDVLKVNFVDVQQGDGAVIESPDGKVILVDGGDNQLFARYLAGRFRGTTAANPKEIECILVTHGDADHFAGLPEIFKSETNADKRSACSSRPKRVYHNGIVKRPSTKDGKAVPEGAAGADEEGWRTRLFLTGLEDDLLKVPDGEMNAPFSNGRRRLRHTTSARRSRFRRLEFGDANAFDFFNTTSDIRIEVLGPLVTES